MSPSPRQELDNFFVASDELSAFSPGRIDGIRHVLGPVAAESAVTLLPGYFRSYRHPYVKFIPVSDPYARWDIIILRQKGQTPPPLRHFIDTLVQTANTSLA